MRFAVIVACLIAVVIDGPHWAIPAFLFAVGGLAGRA